MGSHTPNNANQTNVSKAAPKTVKVPPGAWHVLEARWGEAQRVRLVTGPPSLVGDSVHVRSIHIVGFVGQGTSGIGGSPGKTLLLVQNKDGSWTFPGGRLEDAETLNEALHREVWEEARARLAPVNTPIAATRIEFLNRVPGRVYRVHPTFLLWVTGNVEFLSDEPHHDPADGVIGRAVVDVETAREKLGPLEVRVLEAALALRGQNAAA